MLNSLIATERFVKHYWFYAILTIVVVIFCTAILYQPLDAPSNDNESSEINEDEFSLKSYVCCYEKNGATIYETAFSYNVIKEAKGSMITLLTDIQFDGIGLNAHDSLYINLNGHDLCCDDTGYVIYIRGGADLHITDLSSEKSAGHIYNRNINAVGVINNEHGSVIIDGGYIGEGPSSDNPVINRNAITNESTVTLNGGFYNSTGTTIINKGNDKRNGLISIDGGTFQCTGDSSYLIEANPNSNVMITDGKFETGAEHYLFKITDESDDSRHFSIFGGTYTIPVTAKGYFDIKPSFESYVYLAGGIFSNKAPKYDFIDSEHYVCTISKDFRTFEIIPKTDDLFEVVFDSTGGSEVDSVKCGYNYPMKAPSDPQRDGYVFKGWYLDKDHEYDFNKPVTSNLTLYAKWLSATVTVKFYLDEEKVIETQDVKLGDKILRPSDPTKGLKIFVGWYYKSTCISNQNVANDNQVSPTTRILYDFSKTLDDDSSIITQEASWILTGVLELQALWTSDTDNTVDVFFNTTKGASSENPQHISYGDKANKPSNPQKSYSIFAYWYVDSKPSEPFNFDSQLYQSTYIYAMWYMNHDIIFDPNGGGGWMDPVKFGDIIGKKLPKCSFSNGDKTFMGWATLDGRHIEDEAQMNTPLTDDSTITLYAIWDGFEAQIGDKQYVQLQLALEAAKDGDTVTVLRDIEFNSTPETHSWLYIDKSITLQGLKGKDVKIQGHQHSLDTKRVISVGTLASGSIDFKLKDITIIGNEVTSVYVYKSVKTLEIVNCTLKSTPPSIGTSPSLVLDGDGEQLSVATIGNSTLEGKYALDVHGWVDITISDSRIDTKDLCFNLCSIDDSESSILLQRSSLNSGEGYVNIDNGYSFTMIDCSIDHWFGGDHFFFNPKQDNSHFDFRLVNCIFKLGNKGGIIHGEQNIEGQKNLIGGKISVNPLKIKDNPDGFLDDEYYVAEKGTEDEFFVVKWKINLYDGSQRWGNTTVAYAGLDSEGREYGTSEEPDSHPEREGYRFIGWYVNPECTEKYEFNQRTYSGFNLYAGYIKQFPVSFDPGEGRPIPEVQLVDEGGKAVQPAGKNEPKINGKRLTDWYRDQEYSDKYDFNTPVNNELKLYAKWEIVDYYISFDSQGGSPTPKEQMKHYGDYVTEPSGTDVPSRSGYTFAGWYTDKEGTEKYNFNSPVVSDLVLYAKWNPNKYIVTFDARGGRVPSPTTMEVLMGSKYGHLPTTDLFGYNFNGWYTEINGGIRITSESVVGIPNDHTLYAHWTPNEGESIDILDDGSKIDEQFKTEKDERGRLVTTIDSTIMRIDGSMEHSVSKSIEESVETGNQIMTETTTTFMDSHGNTLSILNTSSTEIRTGNYIVCDSSSVEKDASGKVIANITLKSTTEERMDGSIKIESTETIDTGHSRTVIRTDSVITETLGSTNTSTRCVESVMTSEGTSTSTTSSETSEMNVSSGKVKNIEEKVVRRTASGETFTIETSTTTTVKNAGETAEITEESISTYKDADEKILNIQNYSCTTKILKSTRTQSSVLEISYPDDSKSSVKSMTSIDDADYSIIASATVTDEQGTVTRSASATLSYFDSSDTLKSSDVDRGLAHILSVIEAMEESEKEFEKIVTIETMDTHLKAAPESFKSLANSNSSIEIESSYGVLTYDSDACKTFAEKDSDIEIELNLNDPEDLNEKQKTVIGDSTFVSVTAKSNSEYISELGGTVTMSFQFDNPKSWEHFRVYYVDENGVKHKVQTSYDQTTRYITATSTHQSVYAVLEVYAHHITISTIGEGEVSVSPSIDVLEGETVTLKASAEEGYIFDGWECDQLLIVDNAFTMPDKDVFITGVFYEDLDAQNRQTITIFVIVVAILAALVTGLIIYRRRRLY